MTKTLGVTGGIGSGKTTVCRMLEQLGARVFNADQEGKMLLVDDPTARKAIVDAFGEESYLPGGELNRRYLAEEVFNDEDKLRMINGIVHPRVFRRFIEARERAARDGVSLLVHEAALIYETGAEKHLDAVAVVDAGREIRIKRVMERDGVSRQDVLARMENQLPPEMLRERADFVIENEGDVDALLPRVEEVYRQMVG